MKASDLLIRCLENEGVERIFGVPGEENADVMLSLEDSDIDFILTRHEQGAAFMAEVHGRLTGEVGLHANTTLCGCCCLSLKSRQSIDTTLGSASRLTRQVSLKSNATLPSSKSLSR